MFLIVDMLIWVGAEGGMEIGDWIGLLCFIYCVEFDEKNGMGG